VNNDLLLEVIGQADAKILQQAIGDTFQVSVFPHANIGDFTLRLHPLEPAHIPSWLEIARSLERAGVRMIAPRRSVSG
jgi:hypothetical protein